jgi:hypothetical protein
VGVVVLDDPVYMTPMAELPEVGLVNTLKNKTDLDLVGYGVQEMIYGGGPSYWVGLRNRLYAPAEIITAEFVYSAEFIRVTSNPGGDTGGTCFGDSGGPDLLAGTNKVLAVNSYVTNYNCTGVGYSSVIDIPEVIVWINEFLQ